MDLLQEIRKLSVLMELEGKTKASQSPDPHSYCVQTVASVEAEIGRFCVQNHVTYAEFLETVRGSDPTLVPRFRSLRERVDMADLESLMGVCNDASGTPDLHAVADDWVTVARGMMRAFLSAHQNR